MAVSSLRPCHSGANLVLVEGLHTCDRAIGRVCRRRNIRECKPQTADSVFELGLQRHRAYHRNSECSLRLFLIIWNVCSSHHLAQPTATLHRIVAGVNPEIVRQQAETSVRSDGIRSGPTLFNSMIPMRKSQKANEGLCHHNPSADC
jgi:hypothetical protein